ncbi:hypothetical protein Hanom_Chr12g01145851 [Helianthus anomalus]
MTAAHAVINWKEDEFQELCRNFQFPVNWEAMFPSARSTTVDASPDFITLYTTFFKEGNF